MIRLRDEACLQLKGRHLGTRFGKHEASPSPGGTGDDYTNCKQAWKGHPGNLKLRKKMKKVLMFVFSALLLGGQVMAQSVSDEAKQKAKEREAVMKANRSLNKEKISKMSKKAAKQMKKEGWKVMPGQLPLEQQMERATMFQNQFEDDMLTPKYVWGDASSPAQNYDAGKMQALELARLNLVGSIEARITSIVDNNIGNDQAESQEAVSLVNTLKKAKSIVQSNLGQTIPVVECYRDLENGNKEVRVMTFYSMDKAREIARAAIRKQMEADGKTMTPELEKLLGK